MTSKFGIELGTSKMGQAVLLLGILTLTACGQPAASAPQTGAQAGSPSTVTTRKALGVYELALNEPGSGVKTQATIRPVSGGLSAQATEIDFSQLVFKRVAMSNVMDEAGHLNHMSASFEVTNNTGAPISVPTFVPVDTEGTNATVGATPFRLVTSRSGADASSRASEMHIEQGHQTSGGTVQVDPAATPIVTNLDVGGMAVTFPSGTVAAGVSHTGWQMTQSIPAGGTGIVTFGINAPMVGTEPGADEPFSFRLVFAVTDNPGTVAGLTNIATIQGSTPSGNVATTATGSQTVEGVVTADYRTGTQQGVYLQEEGIDADGDPTTSDGIFVYCGTSCATVIGTNIGVGDRVRVVGTPSEFVTVTQLDVRSGSVTELQDAATVSIPAATPLTLPLDVNLRERYEGMRVSVSGIVTNNFPLGRSGAFDIADARLPQFTQVNAPSTSGYAAWVAGLPNRYIRIDDGTRAQNPDPEIFARGNQNLSAANTLRAGDTASVTGVMGYSSDYTATPALPDMYRIYATQADTNIQPTNPRTNTPDAVGGTLRVGSMNVLNFFTTLVTTNTGCTPNGTDSANARGANNCEEFLRQRTKTVKAIAALNPDVLGLLEMQNDFEKGANSSIANLVNALNAEIGAGTYTYINPGAKVGTDAISVAMIYKPSAVTPVGTLAKLDNTFDPNYIDTCSRPTLAQTFQSNANGGRFTAVMMHLKSKGSACAALNDTDTGDGQGNAWKAREQAAQVIVNWLATNPTGVVEDDRILMGDYNAYELETPLTILANGGYQNLFTSDYYSYQFDGQWGSLDHATASASLAAQVTGKTKWHINSDEPTVLDYNTEFKTPGQVSSFYAADQFRSSDHDPVLVGLNLTAQTPIDPPIQNPSTSLSASPNTFSTTSAGGSQGSTVTVSTQNYSGGNLNVTASGPSGWTVTAPATTAPNGTFTVNITVPSGTAAGNYSVTVSTTGDGGTPTASTTINVSVTTASTVGTPWINEINYDTSATNDAGEFIEVVVPAGVDTSNMSLVLYNGSGGASYKTDAFTSSIVTQTTSGAYTLYTFRYATVSGGAVQNGSPDGIAICKGSSLVQFVSYEGTFAATNGCASGVTSTSIGSVSQDNSSAADSSLQLSGPGNKYSDFTWTGPATSTPGAINTGQTLN